MDNSDQQTALQEWYKQECEKFHYSTTYTQGTFPSKPNESAVAPPASEITNPESALSQGIKSRNPNRLIWTPEEDEILTKAVAAHSKTSVQ